MRIRKKVKKWLYNSCPGFSGSFPYFGTKVYFPFFMACDQGIYESEILKLINSLIKENSYYIDVGANIGLMSVPALNVNPTCKVISLEASPSTFDYLQRSARESKYNIRWRVIGKAAGNAIGFSEFYSGKSEYSSFDGLKNTGRCGSKMKIKVPVTTIDSEWEVLGKPNVSVIKIDIEGAEIIALSGSLKCISTEKPYIFIEWNEFNFRSYNHEYDEILKFADLINYYLFSLPEVVPVLNNSSLKLHMLRTENFLLSPK